MQKLRRGGRKNGFAEGTQTREKTRSRIRENSGRWLAKRRKSHDFRYEPVLPPAQIGRKNGFAEGTQTREKTRSRIRENSGRWLAKRRKSHDFRYEPVLPPRRGWRTTT